MTIHDNLWEFMTIHDKGPGPSADLRSEEEDSISPSKHIFAAIERKLKI